MGHQHVQAKVEHSRSRVGHFSLLPLHVHVSESSREQTRKKTKQNKISAFPLNFFALISCAWVRTCVRACELYVTWVCACSPASHIKLQWPCSLSEKARFISVFMWVRALWVIAAGGSAFRYKWHPSRLEHCSSDESVSVQILPTANPLHHGLMEHITLIPLSLSLSLCVSLCVPFFPFPWMHVLVQVCLDGMWVHRLGSVFNFACVRLCTAKLVNLAKKPRTFHNGVIWCAGDPY